MNWIVNEWKYLWLTLVLALISLIVILLVSSFVVGQVALMVSFPLPAYTWFGIGIIGWILFVGNFFADRIHYVPLRKIHVVQTADGKKRFLEGGLRGLRPGNDELQKDPDDPSKIWEIDLEKALLYIGKTKDGKESKLRIFMTGDDPRQPIAVRYKGVVSADSRTPGALLRRIMYGNDVIVEQFEALIDQNLSDRIAKRKVKEILPKKNVFTAMIEALFRTPSHGKKAKKGKVPIHSGLERHFGSRLDSFAIEEVDLDPDILKAMKAGTEMAIFNEKAEDLVKRMVAAGSKIDGEEALDAILIVAEKKTATSQTITYEGLDNLPNLTVFAPGGSGKVGVLAGDGGKKGKKGGGS